MDNINLFENQITGGLYPVSFAEVQAALGKQLEFLSLKAGEHLIVTGKRINRIYFLLQGAVRQYSISRKGEEINFLFYFEDDFVTDHRSFIDNAPSLFNFLALEDCVLISIDRNDLETLKAENPAWEKLHRTVNEKAIVRLYKRNELLLSNSPEERYNMLVAIHPQIMQRVSLAKIATFIGITVPSLSRIRKRIVSRPVRN